MVHPGGKSKLIIVFITEGVGISNKEAKTYKYNDDIVFSVVRAHFFRP